jgi:hypothetical protein
VVDAALGMPVVVTDIAAYVVASECMKAAATVGAAAGVPVPPPAAAVPSVGIVVPTQVKAAQTS